LGASDAEPDSERARAPFLALARAVVPFYVASDSDTERLRNTKQLAESLNNGELTLRDVFVIAAPGTRTHASC
jgi:hypothetical protein